MCGQSLPVCVVTRAMCEPTSTSEKTNSSLETSQKLARGESQGGHNSFFDNTRCVETISHAQKQATRVTPQQRSTPCACITYKYQVLDDEFEYRQ